MGASLPESSNVSRGSQQMRAAWASFVPTVRCGFTIVGACQYSSLATPPPPRRPAPAGTGFGWAWAASAGRVAIAGAAAAGPVGSAGAGLAGSTGLAGAGVAVGAVGAPQAASSAAATAPPPPRMTARRPKLTGTWQLLT